VTEAQEKRPQVLIADDDISVRKLMQAALWEAGFSVTGVADGDSAINAFEKMHPDLVLLDVEMPGLNGFEVCREIRSRENGRDVPVVMVTGREDIQSVNFAYDAGATDFIVKPINWPLISHRVRYILRGAENVQARAASENKNRALLEAIPDRIFILSSEGTVRQYLSSAATLGDYAANAFIGKNLSDILPRAIAENAIECIEQVMAEGGHRTLEFQLTHQPGIVNYYETRIILHTDQEVMAIVRDISERKLAEEKIHKLAFYDSLTGLPNRQLFLEKLHDAVSVAGRENRKLAALHIDIDRFKRVNDTLGHLMGDNLLESIGKRFERCIEEFRQAHPNYGSPKAALARLGGDEFSVLLTGIEAETEAQDLSRSLKQALVRPFSCGGQQFAFTASIGIAMYPRNGRNSETLTKNANAAMYRAKSSGRNKYEIYNSAMNARSLDQLTLENDLRQAISNDELKLFYQPKFMPDNMELVGAEALCRWFHPKQGEVPPDRFIMLAEEAGLIVELSQWVANTVCRQIKSWQQKQLDPVPVAVNLSGQEFLEGDPVRTIIEATEQAGIDPANLELEITETALMSDMDAVRTSLAKLKDRGFRLAVDDFGTGYSSLSYLKGFPLDTMKIDKSFVKDVAHDTDDAAICDAIIALAHSLGLTVVAEGVENKKQLEFLRTRGCDQVQGYLLGRPVDARRFTDMLMDRQTDLLESDRHDNILRLVSL